MLALPWEDGQSSSIWHGTMPGVRLHRQRAPWPSGVTLGSFGRRRVGRVHAPCAVPRHPTATRTDTSSRREYDSRCAPRNVWLVVRIARRRERRQAGGGGGGGSQEADGRWQVAATPGGMGGLRQRREECEARATLERHRGAFGAPGRPLGRARWRSAAHELLPLMSASQRVVRCTRGWRWRHHERWQILVSSRCTGARQR